MNRRRLIDALSWATSIVIPLALLLGLDPYQRLPLEYGYGPERREYFTKTRERARELQESGSSVILPHERWHLRGGWEDRLSEDVSPEALAISRRARLVLPVLIPEPLRLRIQLSPLSPEGGEPAPIKLEYGVNGIELGRFVVPPAGEVLKFRIEPLQLRRGDNVLYLYRLTKRSDSEPWLALGSVKARVLKDGT